MPILAFPSSVFNAIPQNLHTSMWKESWLIRSSTLKNVPGGVFILGPVMFSDGPAYRTSFVLQLSNKLHYLSPFIVLTAAILIFVDSLPTEHHPLEEREAKPESITLFMPQKIGLTFATVCRYISSTTTLIAFSFYQQYCGPSVLVWLFCRSFGAPRRWRRQTHPSGFSV